MLAVEWLVGGQKKDFPERLVRQREGRGFCQCQWGFRQERGFGFGPLLLRRALRHFELGMGCMGRLPGCCGYAVLACAVGSCWSWLKWF